MEFVKNEIQFKLESAKQDLEYEREWYYKHRKLRRNIYVLGGIYLLVEAIFKSTPITTLNIISTSLVVVSIYTTLKEGISSKMDFESTERRLNRLINMCQEVLNEE